MKNKNNFLAISTIVVAFLSFGLNLNDFIMGYNPNSISCLVSILFIVCCYCFSFINKVKKYTHVLVIYSGFMAIIELVTLLVSTYSLSFDLIIPFALIALPPYYGISLLVGANICRWIIFASSIVLCAINLYQLKKNNY